MKNINTDEDESIILDCVVEAARLFLINDMNVGYEDTIDCKNFFLGKHFSAVRFYGNINLYCVVSMDENIRNTLFNIFVPYEMDQKDIDNIKSIFPDELVNTIAGHAIARFPLKYDSLVLSEPIKLDIDILNSLKEQNKGITKKIKTLEGDLICSIIKY